MVPLSCPVYFDSDLDRDGLEVRISIVGHGDLCPPNLVLSITTETLGGPETLQIALPESLALVVPNTERRPPSIAWSDARPIRFDPSIQQPSVFVALHAAGDPDALLYSQAHWPCGERLGGMDSVEMDSVEVGAPETLLSEFWAAVSPPSRPIVRSGPKSQLGMDPWLQSLVLQTQLAQVTSVYTSTRIRSP